MFFFLWLKLLLFIKFKWMNELINKKLKNHKISIINNEKSYYNKRKEISDKYFSINKIIFINKIEMN